LIFFSNTLLFLQQKKHLFLYNIRWMMRGSVKAIVKLFIINLQININVSIMFFKYIVAFL